MGEQSCLASTLIVASPVGPERGGGSMWHRPGTLCSGRCCTVTAASSDGPCPQIDADMNVAMETQWLEEENLPFS